MDDIYKNVEEYKPNKKRKILIVFDDMIADMLHNKKLNKKLNYLLKTKHLHNLILLCQNILD